MINVAGKGCSSLRKALLGFSLGALIGFAPVSGQTLDADSDDNVIRDPDTQEVIGVRASVYEPPTEREVTEPVFLRANPPYNIQKIVLGEISARERDAGSQGGPLVIGFARDVQPLRTLELTSRVLNASSYDGENFGISISSPGAAAIRIGLNMESIPNDAKFSFFSQETRERMGPQVSGEEINGLIALNRDAGDESEEANIYWSPAVEGDTAIVDIYLPPGSFRSDLQFSIPIISHIDIDIFDPQTFNRGIIEKDAASCNLDATCYTEWELEAKSVALMIVTIDGATFACTGTMLGNTQQTFIPYFISANHCVNSQTVASTLETRWYFQSATCNGTSQDGRFEILHGGATLLHAALATDTAFMLLQDSPPAGSVFAGWWSTLPGIGTSNTAIHHPRGDKKKIAFGTLSAYLACAPADGGFSCVTSNSSSATHFISQWDLGTAEPGSSGGGLQATSGGDNWHLVGTLSSGPPPSSCPEYAIFGRFDIPYNNALHQWLHPTSNNVFSLTVVKSGTGFGAVTSTPSGINCGNDCSEVFNAGTSVTLTATPSSASYFTGWSGACTGAVPCVVAMTSNKHVTANFEMPGLAVSNILFDWAEPRYPQFFSPSGRPTVEILGFLARYYPDTNIYLGTKDGWVYVYGDVFDGLRNVGAVDYYFNLVTGSNQEVSHSLTGTWLGHGESLPSPGCVADLALDMLQIGNQLTGTIDIDGTCTVASGVVNGAVDGKGVVFGAVLEGNDPIEYRGTIADPYATASGTYSWPAANDHGIWNIRRQ